MKKRFMCPSAVMLMLIRENNGKEEILLQKRKNTGYCDGFYDFSATGHVEENESMIKALCREAKEEIGIQINESDLEYVCIIHKKSEDQTYYNGYFKALKWEGMPTIMEKEKNEEIRWFDINKLPENIVNDRIIAIENYKKNIKYSEFGWKN